MMWKKNCHGTLKKKKEINSKKSGKNNEFFFKKPKKSSVYWGSAPAFFPKRLGSVFGGEYLDNNKPFWGGGTSWSE